MTFVATVDVYPVEAVATVVVVDNAGRPTITTLVGELLMVVATVDVNPVEAVPSVVMVESAGFCTTTTDDGEPLEAVVATVAVMVADWLPCTVIVANGIEVLEAVGEEVVEGVLVGATGGLLDRS